METKKSKKISKKKTEVEKKEASSVGYNGSFASTLFLFHWFVPIHNALPLLLISFSVRGDWDYGIYICRLLVSI